MENTTSTHLNITEWAEKMIEKHTSTISEFVREGWELGDAVNFVKNSTTLGDKYWQKVIENVTNA